MKKKILSLIFAAVLLTACGAENTSSQTAADDKNIPEETVSAETSAESIPEETEAEKNDPAEDTAATEESVSEETTAEESSAETETEKVTVPAEEVGYEGMTAVYGNSLKDGNYSISVDSSSSMFKITDCLLTVSGGNMTAEMTMSGSGYGYLFMGSGADAEAAAESEYIPAEDRDGVSVFAVPVEALDKEISCAAFSKKKEEWYDRTLVFRADSLSADAFADGFFAEAELPELADGTYTAEVTLEGGSGKASVQSPAKLTVRDGSITAEIIWSSNKYDYMIVDGEKYLPVSTDEFSVFEIPVSGFDRRLSVSADTTAMSVPYEIEYTLYFDSSTIAENS